MDAAERGVDMQAVFTDEAPLIADALYSQGLIVQGSRFLFCTGQTPRDPQTFEVVSKGDIEGQARQVFLNLGAVLRAAGVTFRNVVQYRIYYTSADYVEPVGRIRREFFTESPFPTVTGLVCALTDPDMLIEVDAVAAL